MENYRIYTPLPSIPSHPDDADSDSSADEDSISSMDDQELQKYARRSLRRIVKTQKLCSDTLADIRLLSSISECCMDKKRGSVFAEFMVSVNYVQITQKLLKNHFREAYEGDDDGSNNEIWASIYSLLFIMWNLSDKTVSFCREILKTKTYVELLNCLKSPHLSADKMGEENPSSTAQCVLCTLHNVVQKVPGSWAEMRNSEAVEILQPIRESSNQMLSCVALMIQAYIITEQDNEKINSGLEVFEFLMEVLSTTMEDEAFYSMKFSVIEIIEVINKLAVNDSNKTKIVEAGALSYYVVLMKGGKCWGDDVIAEAARGLWILGFKCKEEILKQDGCITTLKGLLNHPDSIVREKARGALWILEKQDQLTKKVSQALMKKDPAAGATSEKVDDKVAATPAAEAGHIFISYQWDSKSTVLKVRDRLKAAGYKTWLDEDDMSGSVLEAMAIAVEKATSVIVCLSQKYKDSPNCRTEAEYTFRLRKKIVPLRLQQGYYPDGWLGILVGSKLVFDVSQQTRYEDSVKNLIRELSLSPDAPAAPPQPPKPSVETVVETPVTSKNVPTTTATVAEATSTTSSTKLANISMTMWKEKEISDWLSKNKLQKHKTWFKEFDGNLLQEYAFMLRDAPEAFFAHHFKQNLNMREVLAIGRALRDLL